MRLVLLNAIDLSGGLIKEEIIYLNMSEPFSVNEFVELTFEGEFGSQSPIQGRVLEVDTDPDMDSVSLVVVVEDSEGGRDLVYTEAEIDGEPYAGVTVRNRRTKLGENAEIRLLE